MNFDKIVQTLHSASGAIKLLYRSQPLNVVAECNAILDSIEEAVKTLKAEPTVLDQLTQARDLLQDMSASVRVHKTKLLPDFAQALQATALLNEIHGWRCEADRAVHLVHEALMRAKQDAEGYFTWAEFAPKTGEMRCGRSAPGALRGSHCYGPSFHPDEADARRAALHYHGVTPEYFTFVEPFTEQNIKSPPHITGEGATIPGGWKIGSLCYFTLPGYDVLPTGLPVLSSRVVGRIHAYDAPKNLLTIERHGKFYTQEHTQALGGISGVPGEARVAFEAEEKRIVDIEHDRTE